MPRHSQLSPEHILIDFFLNYNFWVKIPLILTHLRHNLRISTVIVERLQGMEEDADELQHLQAGEVPGNKE